MRAAQPGPHAHSHSQNAGFNQERSSSSDPDAAPVQSGSIWPFHRQSNGGQASLNDRFGAVHLKWQKVPRRLSTFPQSPQPAGAYVVPGLRGAATTAEHQGLLPLHLPPGEPHSPARTLRLGWGPCALLCPCAATMDATFLSPKLPMVGHLQHPELSPALCLCFTPSLSCFTASMVVSLSLPLNTHDSLGICLLAFPLSRPTEGWVRV